MPTSTPRRKRPHPARSARRLAGWLSVAAMAGLTGGMVTASATATTTSSASRANASAAAPTAGAPADATTANRRSSSSAAAAANPSSQVVTVSHAS